MSYELHKNIIEIQSLGRELKLHQDKIEENKKRIDFIKRQRSHRETQKAEDLTKLEKLNTEYQILEREDDQKTEDRRLEILEELDQIKASLDSFEDFMKGSLDSLNKIQSDVFYEDGYEMRDMDHLKMRVQALKDSLAPTERDTVEYCLKYNPYWDFIKYIDGNRCSKCRYIIETSTIQKIENGQLVEACSGCRSLLVSTHAKS